jgi:hypothetical protein
MGPCTYKKIRTVEQNIFAAMLVNFSQNSSLSTSHFLNVHREDFETRTLLIVSTVPPMQTK